MIKQEILQKIRKLEIKTRKAVQSTLGGGYHSVFKGHGINFAEVRHYAPGDDTRLIDWNVTARLGQPHIKIFEEERELTVILAVDISASGLFGTTGQTKLELTAEIAALLGYSAAENRDSVGLLLFSDCIELYRPPKKGRAQMFQILNNIFNHQARSKKTAIAPAIAYLLNRQKRRAVIMLVSDFLDEGYEPNLKLLAKKHDVVPFILADQREAAIPNCGLLALEDQETGEIIYLNTAAKRQREQYQELAKSRQQITNTLFKDLKLSPVRLQTGEAYRQVLLRYFKYRAQRR